MAIQFEWDDPKAASNWKKHQVTFEEASTVFRDLLACIFDDEEHSQTETRELMIGHSDQSRLLIVSFTERGEDRIRIISARKATRKERNDYEEGIEDEGGC